MKKALSFLLVITIMSANLCGLLATATDDVAYEEPYVGIVINGEKKEYKESAVIKGNSIYLPLREMAQDLGVPEDKNNFIWNADKKTITLVSGKKNVVLTIGSKHITVDGKERDIPNAPLLFKGKTYVPLRAVAEAFDMTVLWNANNFTAYIRNTKDYQKCYDVISKVKLPEQKDGTIHVSVKGNFKETSLEDDSIQTLMNIVAMLSINPKKQEANGKFEAEMIATEMIGGKFSGTYSLHDGKIFYKADDGKEYLIHETSFDDFIEQVRSEFPYEENSDEISLSSVELLSMYAIVSEKGNLITLSVPASIIDEELGCDGTIEIITNKNTNELQRAHIQVSYKNEYYEGEGTKIEVIADIDFTK